jgi:putative FmdB family regulatory protein
MPLYEYQCEVCAHRFEVIQKYSDPHIDACPKCGGAVAKLLSSPAIQFKGSGFYLTDYGRAGKSDGDNAAQGKNEAGSSAGDSKSEAKSESKPDSKPDSKSDSKSDSKADSRAETKASGPSASTTKAD